MLAGHQTVISFVVIQATLCGADVNAVLRMSDKRLSAPALADM